MASTAPPASPDLSRNAIYLLQTTLQTHAQHSAMADNKASILIGGSSLIVSIALGRIGQSDANWPLILLGGMSFFSAILAVMSILPAINYHKSDQSDEGNSGNLLFFGSFTQLDEEVHATRVLERLRSNEDIYRMMLHDLYQHGVVLARKKYRLLGYAYRVFLTGLITSVVLLVVQNIVPLAS